MKFNIQVEIDWLEEDDIDDTLKAEAVSQIISHVKGKVSKQVESIVYNQAKNLVNGWIMAELHKFADRPLRITDKWGDTVEHHESLTDMFKEKFDKFFDASVDKNGKEIDGCGYGGKLTRVDYMLNEMAEKYLNDITNNMKRIIERTLNDKMKEKIRQQIVEHTASQVERLAVG